MTIECQLCFEKFSCDEGFQFNCSHNVHRNCPFLISASLDAEKRCRDAPCHDCLAACGQYVQREVCTRATCSYNHDEVVRAILTNTGRFKPLWNPPKSKRFAQSLQNQISAYAHYLRHVQKVQHGQVISIKSCMDLLTREVWDDIQVVLYGSRSCQLSIGCSDIDFQVGTNVTTFWEAEKMMNDLQRPLSMHSRVDNLRVLHHTLWPICRFAFKLPCGTHFGKKVAGETYYNIDLNICSFNAHARCMSRERVLNVLIERLSLRILLLVVKQLFSRSSIGSLPSICLVSMVIAHSLYFPEGSFADALLGFLEFYASFDFENQAISSREQFPLTMHGGSLFVEDPLGMDNLARECLQSPGDLRSVFAFAYKSLKAEMRLTDLAMILGTH